MTKGTSESNQARKTAILVGAIFSLLAGWNVHRSRISMAWILGGLSGALLITGLFIPRLARQFHRAWMRMAAALGFVNSRILLSVMHYAVITPVGAVLRIAGRDPLLRRGPQRDSYWIRRDATRQTREGFERSF